ncbi:MAG TPA: glutamine synthetase family protein [Candidatus Sulfotelmatobacter sp.]|jgi:glutamine synthetase|nr:glutamine synthetase family protein [Candidatus Sulfotelmatobacter sp.]
MIRIDTSLKTFLEIPYDKLEEMNLSLKKKAETATARELQKEHIAYLTKETRIKAITVCFSDLEGRFHMLDYDKKFLLNSLENLTFDGSSIRGFSAQHESDLRLDIDWESLRFLPADVFGPGKVVVFALVLDRNRQPYISDFRVQLKLYADELKKKSGITAYAATEIEGFIVDGIHAEQEYTTNGGFKLISTGGYFHSLPLDKLREFIDRAAEAQRAMGFRNEKDHPEVAPSQFEMNFSYTDILRAADQVQLYKLVCRQVARNMGLTATFLPKPIMGINGSGMHTNFSIAKNGKNIFYEAKGQNKLSKIAWEYISKLLNHAPEICLILNSSVNAYRRLDPHFEAPNQIKVSPIDRGSMIRIPVANENTARIEIRSVAPDANPYLVFYTILKTGNEGSKLKTDEDKRPRLRFLPDNINDAIKLFKTSDYITSMLGGENKEKYIAFKQTAADRSPKALGTQVKQSEIHYHHEVTNQVLWNMF